MKDAELFLVRVWRRGDDSRAVVQRVGADATGVFTEALELGRHLMAAAGRTPEPRPATGEPASTRES
jgi:hypothetical protein